MRTGVSDTTGRTEGRQARALPVRDPLRDELETDLTRLAQETA